MNHLALALLLLLPTLLEARTWTSVDGKSLEADLVRIDQDRVVIRRADGRVFALKISGFSEADQKFVEAERAKAKAAAEVKPTGEFRFPKKEGAVEGSFTAEGRSKDVPEGYVVILFHSDLAKVDYFYPLGETAKPNRGFELTVHHDETDNGPWRLTLYAVPTEAGERLAAWNRRAGELISTGRGKEIKPFDEALLAKAHKLTTVDYLIER